MIKTQPPKNWVITTLDEVAEIHDNLREPVNSSERKKRLGPYPYYGATGQVGWIDDYKQDGEYVLLGEDGAPFFDATKDTAYLVSGKCWVNNHAHVLKGREGICHNKYLLYSLNQTDYRGYANGTTRLKLTQSAMRRIPINLAPLNEQVRIVSKIETLFSELDKGIESLKTAREQLKVYRQAVLKHACEGKLTAEWREENKDKLESPKKLLARMQQERQASYQQQLDVWQTAVDAWEKNDKEVKKPRKPKCPVALPAVSVDEVCGVPALPLSWIWIRPEQIAADEDYAIGIGPFGSNLKVSDYRNIGVPLIFVRNITRSNFSSDLKYIDHEKFDELIAHSVKPLDLVITKMGDPPGECEIYPKERPVAVLTADCLKFRLFEKFADRRFYKNCINSNMVKRQLGLITKGVAQKKISVDRFKTILIPFPPIEEQCAIADRIEELFSIIAYQEATIFESLERSKSLRQSILKKAFCGQLVSQDLNDEPANILLERIRENKSKQDLSNGKKDKKHLSGRIFKEALV